ncbi:MAG: OmpA family protein [Bacteroidetes bacterium]|nr:OmpA family protein [Bacteroidota bacterium]
MKISRLFLLAGVTILPFTTTIKAQVSREDKRFERFGYLQVTVTSMKGVPKLGETIIFEGTNKPVKSFQAISDEKGKFDIWLPKGDTYKIKVLAIGELQDFNTVEIPDKPGAYQGKYQIQFELPLTVTLDDVLFETGKAEIKPSSFKSLNDLAELIKRKKNMEILVVGHTDDRGDQHKNLLLSIQRAEAVKKYLEQKSGATGRIKAEGRGDAEPVESNETEEGRRLNRRTEIRIQKE